MRTTTKVRDQLRRRGWDVARWPRREGAMGLAGNAMGVYGVDHVVDVGANQGQFATDLRRRGFPQPITSFEPQPHVYRQVCELAGSDRAWTVHNVALGDRDSVAPLKVYAASPLSSLLQMTDAYDPSLNEELVDTIEVPVRRLSEYDGEISGRSLMLKIDTQGTEMGVVRGAGPVLDRVRVLMVELAVIPHYDGADNLWRDAVDYLSGLGFELSGMFPIDSDEMCRVREMDGVFVRTSTPRSNSSGPSSTK